VRPVEPETNMRSPGSNSLFLCRGHYWLEYSEKNQQPFDLRHRQKLLEHTFVTRGQMNRNDAKAKALHCLASDCFSASWLSAEFSALGMAISATWLELYPDPAAAEGVWKGRTSGCVRKGWSACHLSARILFTLL